MTSSQPVFLDITQHWARPFIQRLQAQGLINGFKDNTFRPDQNLTRGEFATLLKAAFPTPAKRQYIQFSDVTKDFWAAKAIQTAYESGFISGFPDGRFYPQNPVTRLQVLLALVSGLNLAKGDHLNLEDLYTDADIIPGYATQSVITATRSQLVVNHPNPEALNPNLNATRGEVAAIIYQALVLLKKADPIICQYLVELSKPGIIRTGTHLSVNGRKWKLPWSQWSSGIATNTGISDKGIMQVLGINPLNTTDENSQTVSWFSSTPYKFKTTWDAECRYLKINQLAELSGWDLEIQDQTLNIISKLGTVPALTFEERSNSSQMMVTLNQPTPWELYQQNTQWEVVVDAVTSATVAKPFQEQSQPTPTSGTSEQQNEGETAGTTQKPSRPIVKNINNQTVIQGTLPDGYGVKVSTLNNPNRILIELRQDGLIERDITWTKGLRWRQQYITLNNSRFPVVWLTLNPGSSLNLRPIWANLTGMKGIDSLLKTVDNCQCLAAINGGYFNRNNLLPLGAIRRDGKWFSGPILNRGAIAWNDAGQTKIARFSLKETLISSSGQRLDCELLNTGYVKAGIARYTPEWGESYTPLTANEIVILVENNIVKQQIESTNTTSGIAIPKNGYLLTLRSFRSALSSFSVGTSITIESQTTPSDFNLFPHILGGGPLLLQNGQVVVDAVAEGFNIWFADQSAIRSSVGITAKGEWLIATVHNRVGGVGAKLTEMALLMQQLGATEALNLDGGSSTSLVLGGQLLNRIPDTAAPVHNGLGVFRR
ncbi:phosphodiester glycosidase family protein [Planktothrix mougeotii]|uniref:S-layer homology domain-containing protein n=1 Tax=Planktothrix mougeotii LEGE 06226 TaxID=1828728 RepID=A0ABR9UDS4_9CYAN|nr:phosphodiester glycosidase family protein [Planktothrix mougeotii]MBE9144609.1 S-layer homology domain-containing protein [Planktothrix mougeotii LEGE 06226]